MQTITKTLCNANHGNISLAMQIMTILLECTLYYAYEYTVMSIECYTELTYHGEEPTEDPDEDGEVDTARRGQHTSGSNKDTTP